MLKHLVYFLLGVLLMLLLATWLYRTVRSDRFADDVTVAPPAPPAVLPAFTPPTTPIEMRLASEQIGTSLAWAVGLLFAAGMMLTGSAGWMRFLAWPAAVLAVLFSAWALWDGWSEHGTRVVADVSGLKMEGPAGARAFAWSRVAKVRLVEQWAESNPGRRGFKGVRHRDLVFLDSASGELLSLRMPLRPAEAGAAFQASLPVWTGAAIEIEQRGR